MKRVAMAVMATILLAAPAWSAPLTEDAGTSSYYYEPVNGPRDKVRVEVGDTRSPGSFEPHVSFKRWNGEVAMGLRLVDTWIPGNVSTSYDAQTGKLTWQKKQGQNYWRAVFYDRPDIEDGGFEFEVHLPAKPPQNYLQFEVDSTNLNWYFQPPLTPDEIAAGYEQPANVAGSYAVYHATKGGLNRADDPVDYKAGKAFHFYRPHAVDSANPPNETWGDMTLNGNILTVSIPQAFLDSATYPVIVDPTIGYTTNGATAGTFTASCYATALLVYTYTASSGDTVTDVNIYGRSNASRTADVTLYNYSGGFPVTQQFTPETVYFPDNSPALRTSTVSWALTASTAYAIAFGSVSGSSVYIYRDLGGSNDTDYVTACPLPATWTHGGYNNEVWTVWATVTSGGGGGGAVVPIWEWANPTNVQGGLY